MKKESRLGFGTLNIHSATLKDQFGALATPIYQTSTFCFDSYDEAVASFEGSKPSYLYSRAGNPTNTVLQEKLAVLEEGESAVVTASGMGAIGAVFLAFLNTGDHIICAEDIYGSTDVAIRLLVEKFAIEVDFVDTSKIEDIKSKLKDNTALIYCESPSNPLMKLTDIKEVSKIAKSKGIKFVVDNTFAPPPIQFPLREGADIVLHSLTKYINGHGDIIGGAVIGCKDDISLIASGSASKICGSTASPFNSYLIIRGLQTMELRMQRHSDNAMSIAKFLEQHPYIEKVYYPGLNSHPQHEIAKRQMNGMYSGILSFSFKDGVKGKGCLEIAKEFIDNLELISIGVSLGDAASLIQQPWTMTHASVPKEKLRLSGVGENLFRLSAGLENTEDLIADIATALDKI